MKKVVYKIQKSKLSVGDTVYCYYDGKSSRSTVATVTKICKKTKNVTVTFKDPSYLDTDESVTLTLKLSGNTRNKRQGESYFGHVYSEQHSSFWHSGYSMCTREYRDKNN